MSEDQPQTQITDIRKLGVSESWIEGIFQELSRMDVTLEQDPLSYGPKYLTAKIARCRNYLSRTEQLFNEISYRLSVAKRLKLRCETDFTVKESHLLTNDPTVRSQRSVSDRKAQVVMALIEEKRVIQEVESVLQDLENTLTVVKSKRADLKDIQGRIRDQIKLCQELVALGNHWGSRLPPNTKAPDLSKARGYVKDESNDLDSVIDTDDREELTEDLDYAEEPELDALLEAEVSKPATKGTFSKLREEIASASDEEEDEEVEDSGEVEPEPTPDPPQPESAPAEDPPKAEKVEGVPTESKDEDLEDFLNDLGVTEPIEENASEEQKPKKADPPKADPPKTVSEETLEEVVADAVEGKPNAGDDIFKGKEEKTASEVAGKLEATVSKGDVDTFFDAMEENLEPESSVVSEEIDFDDLLGDL